MPVGIYSPKVTLHALSSCNLLSAILSMCPVAWNLIHYVLGYSTLHPFVYAMIFHIVYNSPYPMSSLIQIQYYLYLWLENFV